MCLLPPERSRSPTIGIKRSDYIPTRLAPCGDSFALIRPATPAELLANGHSPQHFFALTQ
jgi:hypothetical protein